LLNAALAIAILQLISPVRLPSFVKMTQKYSKDSIIFFYFCVSVYRSISEIKHRLDATLCRFYFCRVTLHVSGVKRPSSGVFKTGTAATGTCVIVAGRSSHHHIRDEVPNISAESLYMVRPKHVE